MNGSFKLSVPLKQVTDNNYCLPNAELNWQGNHPVSIQHNDGYWAVGDVLAEKSHVFSSHHDLTEKALRTDFLTIIETGFGFGNNFLLSCQQWVDSGSTGILHYIGIEKAPPSQHDLNKHLSQINLPLSPWLAKNYPLPLKTRFTLWPTSNIRLTLIFDDAKQALADSNFQADIWYLDGFRPVSNPDLWNQAIFNDIYRNSKPGSTISSFTVAGKVREGLSTAGFKVFKAPGFGTKRQMLSGYKPGTWQPDKIERSKITIIGAGIAGQSVQAALLKRGFQATLFDSPKVATTSNVPTMNLYPQLATVADEKSKYSISANHYAIHDNTGIKNTTLCWQSIDPGKTERMQTIARQFPDEYISEHDNTILFHQAGISKPITIDAQRSHVASLEQVSDGWLLKDRLGQIITSTQQVILAAGVGMNDLQPIPLQLSRGQSILAESTNQSPQNVSGDISIAQVKSQLFHAGSTYHPGDNDLNQRAADSTYLLDLLNRSFPLSDWSLHSSWVGIRAAPVDRNPLVGPAPLWQLLEQNPFKWFHNQPIPTQKGLFYSTGFGSKGASHAPLAGEHLVNLMTGEPSPLSSSQQKFLSPGRFWLQQARQKTARKRHQPS